ncbi:MAG: acyl-CoA dehydrogenase [Bacteroidetes bacterium GWF2_42_66]|nr:MAG: acyl-CoA dehydrogenase [Bacteroidetes bacterium GWA2_42_15]OFY00324.1 MAG: acyl-CoA dehydrogenase [Bacteroidetes bacterium GWE2_42_39]OFY47106.1 MAG: acyl-CoA dehydrogenase [Bacteroidetes bacterium GWF2_42_66]HBL76719.1 acyl-CoA dehydrogenase [Prolixibacteraceae bacterium]HCR91707.1 acyl-CoA dehydrogenase [Prolixibacteraceae bacterium]
MYPVSIANQISFTDFLDSFKKTLKSVFYERDQIEKFIQKRGFPALVLRDIMAVNPLSVAIPKEYGGRGAKVKECLGLMDAAAYESLPLSLTFGINMALFLQPVAKYASEHVKEDIFERFLERQNMGGLMITEPDYGSDALNMQTSNEKIGSKYHIKGTKHWQGLTGLADYWLMTSRPKNGNGELGRDIDFFICDVQQPEQYIQVEEYYNNIGLYPIPYGKNIIDIRVPEQFKLEPESTGLKLMMDLLHRSRMQFPGMGMGFIRRMLDEAINHCNSRMVAGKSLMSLDQVQHQVAKIQNAFTVSSAMCSRSAEFSGIENNLASATVEAGSMKAYVTDLMQESAQTLTQLSGANGYREEHVASRGIIDSRPFMIFEGSNEMLYTQISDSVLKLMGRQKIMNLSVFLKNYDLAGKVADYFKSALDFSVDFKMPQRKMVDLGRIISRVISANHVASLAEKGFRDDLVSNSLENIKHEILMLVSSYKFQTQVVPVEDYHDRSSWMTFS